MILTVTSIVNYAVSITAQYTAAGPSPGAPVQAFTAVKSYVQGTAFPAPALPTIVIT